MHDQSLTFDRSKDVSKLEGCNTRGIAYRWDIFAKYLPRIPAGTNVLDFGAGSLRETYDLVQRGFNVTSLDLDADALAAYKGKYDWPVDAQFRLVANPDLFASLDELGDPRFGLITCFDVIEHLADPAPVLSKLARCLDDQGLIFCSVPNGRTLFEIALRIDLLIARATNRPMRPGEPHLQRNSPRKWRRVIAESGLNILDHEMHIGFFVNTSAALIQLPLALGGRIVRKLGVPNNAVGLSERIINHGPQAQFFDLLDRYTKPLLSGLYGWNLFVLSRTRQQLGDPANGTAGLS